ncbi:hypothetical protein [Ornithinimicrobium avium]|uniref:Uncharacterized protein n=1 Tax=Ornithinimicrobium avium TaxID=2283195 RepID=A0A345NKI6_9MICO|nr:hypothetical protein [Ornithinimicrobium avium]AXH95544.1 hypothetical protein DV701_04870 [Ornithinimicrobium avium]
MSRSTDRSGDASPFAWIFGTALAAVAVSAVARTVLGRRRGVPPQARAEAPGTAPRTPAGESSQG